MLSHLRPGTHDQPGVYDDGEIEKLEADAKAERIRFHREKVRNGPGKFTTFTNGQVRRTLQREDETRRRKLNKRHRRDWMAKRAELATLRGHLVIMGVLECRDESHRVRSPHQAGVGRVAGPQVRPA
jgi:hypothetical protein